MQEIRARFSSLVSAGSGELDGELDLGALLIASAVDPGVVVDDQLVRLDALAEEFDGCSAAELSIGLFGGAAHDPAVHFAGNRTDYYDIENSLLHRVLDRRLGIPITLAVVLLEVGRRAGTSLHGVGMPGHFLVGSADGFIDPFHGGVVLDADGCGVLFRRLAGPAAVLPPGSLARTPPAEILRRMLVNLAAIGVDRQDRRTVRAVRSLLATFPDATHRDHVQHAYAAAELAQFDEAAAAAERAMHTVPDQVRPKLQAQVDGWLARLN